MAVQILTNSAREATYGVCTRLPAVILLSVIACLDVRGSEPPLRSEVDQAYRARLDALTKKCVELGLERQAQFTRDWLIPRDPDRQYLFSGQTLNRTSPLGDSSDLSAKWLAKLTSLRREHANQLFDIARQQAIAGDAPSAYRLLHEVLHEDPQHAEARRILGPEQSDEAKPRSRASRLAHAKYGWPRGKWWHVESRHFEVVTNESPAAAVELTGRLERFYDAWRQVFFSYWSSPEWLAEWFSAGPSDPSERAKHQVVLFRSRDEYVRQLEKSEPQIALTLGYYHKANRTCYFYSADSLLPVVYHEATHQLFQETGNPIADVGEKWNFWAVEGIAVYMESFVDHGEYMTVGGFDADRLQFARSRVLGGEELLPFNELVRLGRASLQMHADIRRIYTQAAGAVHYWMDSNHGRFREPFVQYLTKIYLGNDAADSLFQLPGTADGQYEKDLAAFLTVDETDLQFLKPSTTRRNLSLIRARITNESLGQIAENDRLEWLDLSFTPVNSDGLKSLEKLATLQRISLVGTRIDDRAVETLGRLPKLEELDLSATAISDAAMIELGKLSKLKVLRLAHTQVTDEGIRHLESLKQLEELDLDQTAVTRQALESLKEKLPQLR